MAITILARDNRACLVLRCALSMCVCVRALEPSINYRATERNVWLLTLGNEIAQVSPHFDAVINASIVFHLQQDEFQIPTDLYLLFVSMWAHVCVVFVPLDFECFVQLFAHLI